MKMMIIIKKEARSLARTKEHTFVRASQRASGRMNERTVKQINRTPIPAEYSFGLKIIKQVGNDSNKPQEPASHHWIKNNKKKSRQKVKKRSECNSHHKHIERVRTKARTHTLNDRERT